MGEQNEIKNTKHIGFYVSFSIIMLLSGALFFFVSDLFGLKLWALILGWVIYALFLAAGILLLKKRKWWVKALSYTGLVATLVVCLLTGGPSVEAKKAYNFDAPIYTDEVSLVHGRIRGVVSQDGQTNIYTGIPYAKAPVGELRWKPPVEEDNWEGVKDCIYFAPKCTQNNNATWLDSAQTIVIEEGYHPDFSYKAIEPQSEDCLYLNVYSPKNATEDLPVLVYIHGGSLSTGSSSFEEYNGEMLSKQGIVVVTIAYRLNVFGYFAHPDLAAEDPNHTTGNYGLLDQIRALKWVQDNIASFHGDKTKVTIAGESAGSSSVSALCVAKGAEGLFRYAIGESSSVATKLPPHTFRTYEKACETGTKIMEEFGCASIEELRQIPAEKLVKTSYSNSGMTVDGYVLEKTPYELYLEGKNHEAALLHGCNAQEADPFTIPDWLFSGIGAPAFSNWKQRIEEEFGTYAQDLIDAIGNVENDAQAYRAYNDIISAYWFNYPDYSWGQQSMNAGGQTYRYLFTKENGYMGTWHSGEMIYAYNNLRPTMEQYPYRYTDEDLQLADAMSKYWVNFVKTGNPNGTGVPQWQMDTLGQNKVMELGDNLGMINDPFAPLYPTLRSFEDRVIEEPAE